MMLKCIVLLVYWLELQNYNNTNTCIAWVTVRKYITYSGIKAIETEKYFPVKQFFKLLVFKCW